MGTYAIVDSSQAPIVHVRVVGEPSDEGFTQYLDDVDAAFRGLDRFGMVFNTGSLAQLPAKYRNQLSEWLTATQPEFNNRFLCSAFVIERRMIRGVLMTVFWLSEPYYTTKVVAHEADAWSWTRARLAEAGVPTHPQRERALGPRLAPFVMASRSRPEARPRTQASPAVTFAPDCQLPPIARALASLRK